MTNRIEGEVKGGVKVINRSPDQLRRQLKQVNIHRIIKQGEKPFSLPDQSVIQTPPIRDPDYLAYVASLRELRKFQRRNFLEQQENSPESDFSEPMYYRANYDPNLARSVLDHLITNSELRRLKGQNEKLSEISGNERQFNEFLRDEMIPSAYITANHFHLLENAISRESFVEGLKKFLPRHGSEGLKRLLEKVGFEKVSKYLTREDIRTAYRQIAAGVEIVEIVDEGIHEKISGDVEETELGLRILDHTFLVGLAETQDLDMFFTQEELHDLVRTYIENHTSIFLGLDFDEVVTPLLNKGVLDQELLKKIIQQSIKGIDFISNTFQILKHFPDIVSKDTLHDWMKQAFMEMREGDLTQLSAAERYLSQEEMFSAAKKYLERNPNISYITLTSDISRLFPQSSWYELIKIMINHPDLRSFEEARSTITYSKKFTPEQRYDLYRQLLTNWEQVGKVKDVADEENDLTQRMQKPFEGFSTYGGDTNVNVFFGGLPKQTRGEIALILFDQLSSHELSPGDFRRVFVKSIRHLSGDDIAKIVEQSLSDKTITEDLLVALGEWSKKIDDMSLFLLLQKIAQSQAEIFASRIHIVLSETKRFSADQFKSLFETVSFENPFSVLYYMAEYDEEFTNKQLSSQFVIETGLKNKIKISFAPKLFRDIFHQLSTTSNKRAVLALAQQGQRLYEQISAIQENGFEETVKSILSKEKLSSNQEQELIQMFASYARLRSEHPEIFNQASLNLEGISFAEAKILSFRIIDQVLENENATTIEQVRIFNAVMGSTTPFLIYLSQHKDSEQHKKLLRDIYESIVQGDFRKWKFNGSSEDFFAQLKQASLLPENLTLSQYSIWQQDGQTTLYDTLSADSLDIARSINQYLKDNIEHLGISHIINIFASGELTSYDDLLLGVSERIGKIGQDLHTINQELNVARKADNLSSVERFEIAKKEREKERTDLIMGRSIIRLLAIDPREVSAGTFLEGKDRKQKGESLFRFLDRIKEQVLPDDRFVYDQIKNLLSQVNAGGEEKQNLYCTDSSDPKVMLEIGETPVSSCQSYDEGSENECLLGYSDPNTKILIVRNEKGNIVARSIFRLLSNSKGSPVLHVERIYSAVASDSISRIIYTRAVKKAEEIGFPVVVSKKSQTEAGDIEDARSARGFSLTSVPYSLKSYNSRAPYTYVDSAAKRVTGQYELTNLLEIKQAA